MIYEFRTYTLKPGSVPEVEALFEERLPHREKFSKLTAFWHTEVGPLNQIVHVWEYEDPAERMRLRAESVKGPQWPPPIGQFVVDMKSDIYIPFPGSPTLKPGKLGPVYEMRTYTFKPGSLPQVIEAWNTKIEERVKLSPLAGVLYTDAGALNQFSHIWAYKSMDERMAIRKTAVDTGAWPPPTRPFLLTMQNKLMLPSSFSRMQ
ncbi:MAG: NIPSNAP family protein [Candidatus Lambdaproteobacteria bacterium]|nr:NIPSNAP family protein [Candidatus Lambdaproteobacteria bacterium]